MLLSARGDRFGTALAPYVDVDADGVRDCVVTNPWPDQDGEIWILSGASGAPLRYLAGPKRLFGTGVLVLEDLDDDGLPEICVAGVADRAPTQVLSPGRRAALATFPEGGSCARVRDHDGDGRADLAVRRRIYSSRTPRPIEGVEPPPVDWILVEGSELLLECDAERRWRLSTTGAVVPGWLRGARAIALDEGERSDALLVVLLARDGRRHELLAFDVRRGEVRYRGETSPIEGSRPLCLAAIGDVDADGAEDFAVAEHPLFEEGLSVRSGRTGKVLGRVPVPEMQRRDTSACPLADVDGDGHADFLVGAIARRGSVRLVSGRTLEPLWSVGRPEDF
jgi:hypothetical protein